jgi:hypothetical protein
MYVSSLMEQNCYLVSKRSIPSDNVPADGPSRPLPGAVSFALSTYKLEFCLGGVNSTSVLSGLRTKRYLLNEIENSVSNWA